MNTPESFSLVLVWNIYTITQRVKTCIVHNSSSANRLNDVFCNGHLWTNKFAARLTCFAVSRSKVKIPLSSAKTFFCSDAFSNSTLNSDTLYAAFSKHAFQSGSDRSSFWLLASPTYSWTLYITKLTAHRQWPQWKHCCPFLYTRAGWVWQRLTRQGFASPPQQVFNWCFTCEMSWFHLK